VTFLDIQSGYGMDVLRKSVSLSVGYSFLKRGMKIWRK